MIWPSIISNSHGKLKEMKGLGWTDPSHLWNKSRSETVLRSWFRWWVPPANIKIKRVTMIGTFVYIEMYTCIHVYLHIYIACISYLLEMFPSIHGSNWWLLNIQRFTGFCFGTGPRPDFVRGVEAQVSVAIHGSFRRPSTFQRLFQHTPRAHPRQSPKPIMKEIPL